MDYMQRKWKVEYVDSIVLILNSFLYLFSILSHLVVSHFISHFIISHRIITFYGFLDMSMRMFVEWTCKSVSEQ